MKNKIKRISAEAVMKSRGGGQAPLAPALPQKRCGVLPLAKLLKALTPKAATLTLPPMRGLPPPQRPRLSGVSKRTLPANCLNAWPFSASLQKVSAVLWAAILLLPIVSSCDLLRTSPFEVSRWSPGGGYQADSADISLFMEFSHEPDRASVERHFSFTGDGDRLAGNFRWEKDRLLFIPAVPLEPNRDYEMAVAAEAHDTAGLSMDRAFAGRFSTRPDRSRPALLACSPPMNGIAADARARIRLDFSRPVSLNSLREAVSISPVMGGSWRLEDEGRAGVFTPAEPWTAGKRYEIRVSESLAGVNGMSMGRDFASVFIAGEDGEQPVLLGAWRLAENGGLETLEEDSGGAFRENSGWEKQDRLRLVFSEPVDLLSVRSLLSAEGAPSLALETAADFTSSAFAGEAVFRFEKAPAFESRFSFRLKGGIKDLYGNESAGEHLFRIFADGAGSKPPALVGIRIPMSPANAADLGLLVFNTGDLFPGLPLTDGNYPSGTKTPSWIECYFETAPGLSVEPLSLMELFRVEAGNNALSFSAKAVKDNNFSAGGPHPQWAHLSRLEIQGELGNTVNGGLVHIVVAGGLRDSGGNVNEKAFRVSLVK